MHRQITIYFHEISSSVKISSNYQVLNCWLKTLPDDYTVSDFIAEVKEWYNDGFLDDGIKHHLQKIFTRETLQIFEDENPVAEQTSTSPGTIPAVVRSVPDGAAVDTINESNGNNQSYLIIHQA